MAKETRMGGIQFLLEGATVILGEKTLKERFTEMENPEIDMEKIKINNEKFKTNLNNILNLSKIYNYYGLIEQTGSIFIECQKCSCFITSIFSDVIIRDKHMKVLPPGEKGFIQLISILPKSYPGHIILTEDIGEIVENDCNCKNLGKRFKVHGRSEKSEIRGCSDI